MEGHEIECVKTFQRHYDEVVSRVTLKTADCDIANAGYYEVLAALHRIMMLEVKENNPADTLIQLP